MKVKKETLIDFLKASIMTGVSAITEAIVDFNKEGIEIKSTSASNLVLINSVLKATAITDYEAIGQIGMHNLQDVVKLLEGFNKDEIKFFVKDNKLVFSSSNRRVKITLQDKDVTQKPTNFPEKQEKKIPIPIDIDILKNFFKNMSMINSNEFVLSVKNNYLYFHAKDFNEVMEKIPVKWKSGDVSLKLNRAFIDAIENLDGEVILKLKTDYPVEVNLKNDGYAIKILVAPVTKK